MDYLRVLRISEKCSRLTTGVSMSVLSRKTVQYIIVANLNLIRSTTGSQLTA